jgi:long-subunit fatty acid transport protein
VTRRACRVRISLRAAGRAARCLGVLLLLGLTREASAWDALELFGFSARGTALCGALTGGADDAAAAFYNPAGAALAAEPQLALGWTYAYTKLTLDRSDAHVLRPHGMSLGAALPWHRGNFSAALALGVYMPDQFVLRIQVIPPSEPHFGLLDNGPHRFTADAVVALRWRALALGAGVSFLTDANGRIDLDVGLSGGEKQGRAALDFALPTKVAPFLGLLARVGEQLNVGLSYRGELDLRLALDILAKVDVAGVVSGDAAITLRAINFYTPAKLAAGARLLVTESLAVNLDLVYFRWSALNASTPELRVLLDLGLSPPLVSAAFPASGYRDTLSERAGIELTRRGRLTLRLRAGAAVEPSPVPDQHGLVSVADNDRLVLGAGGGLELVDRSGILRHPVSLDAGVQVHHLLERTTVKADPSLGPGFTSGGDIVVVSITATGRF